jgi:hypothetical protein
MPPSITRMKAAPSTCFKDVLLNISEIQVETNRVLLNIKENTRVLVQIQNEIKEQRRLQHEHATTRLSLFNRILDRHDRLPAAATIPEKDDTSTDELNTLLGLHPLTVLPIDNKPPAKKQARSRHATNLESHFDSENLVMPAKLASDDLVLPLEVKSEPNSISDEKSCKSCPVSVPTVASEPAENSKNSAHQGFTNVHLGISRFSTSVTDMNTATIKQGLTDVNLCGDSPGNISKMYEAMHLTCLSDFKKYTPNFSYFRTSTRIYNLKAIDTFTLERHVPCIGCISLPPDLHNSTFFKVLNDFSIL